jgi:hypothetical protein
MGDLSSSSKHLSETMSVSKDELERVLNEIQSQAEMDVRERKDEERRQRRERGEDDPEEEPEEEEPPPSANMLELYEKLLASVEIDVARLRIVLEAAEAKEREREWMSNMLTGDLDDSKIVDGVAGERRIYRKRGEPEKKLGLQQKLPKRIVFAVDVSASMSRMNAWDGRLDRMASAMIMLMETLSDPSVSHKFDFCIVGHSGVEHELLLVNFGSPPRSRDERARVIEKMYAHARSASTGDKSLQAAEAATKRVSEEVADDHLVFLLSDANLGRYNVSPAQLASALQSDASVTGHAIFVAEESAAAWLAKEMPPGRGHAALNAADLVKALKEAFESSVVVG